MVFSAGKEFSPCLPQTISPQRWKDTPRLDGQSSLILTTHENSDLSFIQFGSVICRSKQSFMESSPQSDSTFCISCNNSIFREIKGVLAGPICVNHSEILHVLDISNTFALLSSGYSHCTSVLLMRIHVGAWPLPGWNHGIESRPRTRFAFTSPNGGCL